MSQQHLRILFEEPRILYKCFMVFLHRRNPLKQTVDFWKVEQVKGATDEHVTSVTDNRDMRCVSQYEWFKRMRVALANHLFVRHSLIEACAHHRFKSCASRLLQLTRLELFVDRQRSEVLLQTSKRILPMELPDATNIRMSGQQTAQPVGSRLHEASKAKVFPHISLLDVFSWR